MMQRCSPVKLWKRFVNYEISISFPLAWGSADDDQIFIFSAIYTTQNDVRDIITQNQNVDYQRINSENLKYPNISCNTF